LVHSVEHHITTYQTSYQTEYFSISHRIPLCVFRLSFGASKK
jgi:hypothetical protein